VALHISGSFKGKNANVQSKCQRNNIFMDEIEIENFANYVTIFLVPNFHLKIQAVDTLPTKYFAVCTIILVFSIIVSLIIRFFKVLEKVATAL